MSNKKTAEEKFLQRAYEVSLSAKEELFEMDAFEIGKMLGQREHKVKIIIQHLARTYFIEKKRENFFTLTQKGINLCKDF
jgi:Mn-dependent DtxR family transcriptional regulator